MRRSENPIAQEKLSCFLFGFMELTDWCYHAPSTSLNMWFFVAKKMNSYIFSIKCSSSEMPPAIKHGSGYTLLSEANVPFTVVRLLYVVKMPICILFFC